MNINSMDYLFSNRTIREYAEEIWKMVLVGRARQPVGNTRLLGLLSSHTLSLVRR
ncbi:hypothetical protein [Sodalis-like endosymbiont of Proechinophthirus fluctus]|uniref:hypothetical protein n=1 Tax=Sodalis-like endosymbiont of Proechinophthirus fluctus TaxID=1462730 RepID=UPI000B19337A